MHHGWADRARHIDKRIALNVNLEDITYWAESSEIIVGMTTVVVDFACSEACNHTFGYKVEHFL